MSRRTRSPEYKARKVCKKKQTFRTEFEGWMKVAFYKDCGLRNDLWPYQCKVCWQWHNTSGGWEIKRHG